MKLFDSCWAFPRLALGADLAFADLVDARVERPLSDGGASTSLLAYSATTPPSQATSNSLDMVTTLLTGPNLLLASKPRSLKNKWSVT